MPDAKGKRSGDNLRIVGGTNERLHAGMSHGDGDVTCWEEVRIGARGASASRHRISKTEINGFVDESFPCCESKTFFDKRKSRESVSWWLWLHMSQSCSSQRSRWSAPAAGSMAFYASLT